MSAADSTNDTPALDVRVVRGTPTDEELAAVVAVLSAVASTPHPRSTSVPPVLSGWQLSQRDLRRPLHDTRWG